MRLFLGLVVAASPLAWSPSFSQQNGTQTTKSICIIEKAAGVLGNKDSKETSAKAVKFDERHSHFVLTVKPIVRDQMQREFCLASLSHWTPILAEKGTFDPSDQPMSAGGDIKKFYDYRANLGPNCFASSEAKVKFFDRESESRLVSYDFLPTEFESVIPGNWLRMYGDNFEAGETLDSGPIVFTGTCSRVE
jgi:hypothetical protein